jgi:hypothetical protein
VKRRARTLIPVKSSRCPTAPIEVSQRQSSYDEEPMALESKMIQFFADQQLSQNVSTVPSFFCRYSKV